MRTFGQLLLLLAALAGAYSAYKKWKTYRAVRRVAGKVVLITGASSGLGEGMKFNKWVWLINSIPCISQSSC